MSNRYPGGFITADSPTVNTGEADGIWTLEQQANYQGQGVWPRPFYPIERSLRFNSADSAYLSWTPANAGNRRTWTWSGWVKLGDLTKSGTSGWNTIFGAYTDDNNRLFAYTRDSTNGNVFQIFNNTGGSTNLQLVSNQVFRDASAWYHFVVALDTTQATSANRCKVYVNGSQITSWATATYPSQNADLFLNNNNVHLIGANYFSGLSLYHDGYLAETHFIDGQALDPSSFGATNANTGVWSPIAYTGTYGQNGFYLPFNDNSSTEALGLNGFPVDAGATPTLLLNTNGVDADQNNTFLDSSTNAFTITRNGNTTQGTFSPFAKADGEWSNYFDGSGDYISSVSTDFDVATGDFTAEALIFPTSTLGVSYGNLNLIIGSFASNVTNDANGAWYVACNSTGKLRAAVYAGGASYGLTSTTDVQLNQWQHVALVRSGNDFYLYLNGARVASTTQSITLQTQGRAYIGGCQVNSTNGYEFPGYISNARFVKGTAIYTTASITVPTAPLTAVANTKWLTCQSNRFVDNSSSPKTITITGNPSVQPFSPFAPSSAYSASVNGGSGYFDGSGDYLNVANNAAVDIGTGAFTVETWVYPLTFEFNVMASSANSGGFFACTTGANYGIGIGSVNVAWQVTSSVYPKLNAWNHLVYTRDGSNNVAIFLNGSRIVSTTSTNNWGLNGGSLNVGGQGNTSNTNAYFSDSRLVKGSAVYSPTSTTLTVPTAPLTAIANTSLLLNFTNAGIYDATGDNDIETVGDAQVDTAVTKFGSSVKFDGTGDYLSVPQSVITDLGSGDFTVEFWVYFNAIGSEITFVGKTGSGGSYGWFVQLVSGNLRVNIGNNGSLGTSRAFAWSPSTSQWYHVAVSRSNGSLRAFIDGTQIGSTVTETNNGTSTASTGIGINLDGVYQALNGYIEDLRISKGIARYTGPFTPPTAAFTYPQTNDNVYQYLWTPNNFSVTAGAGNDSLVDVPTQYGVDTGAGGEVRGNYATLNPLAKGTNVTVSNGNLDYTAPNSAGAYGSVLSTIAMSSGKWYCEYVWTSGSTNSHVGIATGNINLNTWLGNNATGYSYYANGTKYNNGSSAAYGASYTTNDVIGVAFDADAGTLTFYKNNVSQGTAFTGLTNGPYFFGIGMGESGQTATINFGQRPFAYTAPSGFKALCTTNLPDPTVVQGDDYFNTVLWTGDSVDGRAITGVGFASDFTWIKSRNAAYVHALQDTVRGAGAILFSNLTNAEDTSNGGGSILSFDSDGFSLDNGTVNNTYVNNSGTTYVAWNWNAGGSNATNTDGTITSTVRANPTAGISIVTFSTNSSSGNATIGHGLGVAPKLVIVKSRNATYNWDIYHGAISNAKDGRLIFTTAAFTTALVPFGGVDPTSSVFTLSQSFYGTGIDCVAYCFAPIPGFSAFGSYTGNGSTDGPFLYTGFRPAWVMIKRTDTTNDWEIQDATRSPFNVSKTVLAANSSNSEASYTSGYEMDILSSGFKLKSAGIVHNASGGTYVYAAFAENPFKYALAR